MLGFLSYFNFYIFCCSFEPSFSIFGKLLFIINFSINLLCLVLFLFNFYLLCIFFFFFFVLEKNTSKFVEFLVSWNLLETSLPIWLYFARFFFFLIFMFSKIFYVRREYLEVCRTFEKPKFICTYTHVQISAVFIIDFWQKTVLLNF